MPKESSRAKNLGWTKAMASELKKYEIKVEDMQDKDTYRGQISYIFFKPRGPTAVEQAKTEGESQ